MPIAGVDRINFAAVAARQPKNLAVRRHTAHIRTGMSRYGPLSNDFSILKTDDGNRAFVPIGAIEELRIPARVKTMGSMARCNETYSCKCIAVNEVHSVLHHVGDIEYLAVRRGLYILGHAATCGMGSRVDSFSG